MARCSAYGTLRNNEGQSQSVGGRRGSPHSITAWLNTDTGLRSDVDVTASADVSGERGGHVPKFHRCPRHPAHDDPALLTDAGEVPREAWDDFPTAADDMHNRPKCPRCGQLQPGHDTRRACFTFELPEPGPDVSVRIERSGYRLAALANLGAALVAVQGCQMAAEGDEDGARARFDFIADHLADLERDERGRLPAVTLPGGVDLAHALACVRFVRGMTEREQTGE